MPFDPWERCRCIFCTQDVQIVNGVVHLPAIVACGRVRAVLYNVEERFYWYFHPLYDEIEGINDATAYAQHHGSLSSTWHIPIRDVGIVELSDTSVMNAATDFVALAKLLQSYNAHPASLFTRFGDPLPRHLTPFNDRVAAAHMLGDQCISRLDAIVYDPNSNNDVLFSSIGPACARTTPRRPRDIAHALTLFLWIVDSPTRRSAYLELLDHMKTVPDIALPLPHIDDVARVVLWDSSCCTACNS